MPQTTPIFEVSDSVFAERPDYIVGCVLAKNINNKRPNTKTASLLEDAVFRAHTTYAEIDLKTVPEIAAWRQAFSQEGWSPSKYPSSAEAILKRVSRGNGMPSINPAVDLANASVLFYSVPIGTHDCDTFVDGPLTVRRATDDDCFFPMGADATITVPDREVVYACGADIRTRRWVWRQSQSALVTSETTDVLFPIDGFLDLTDSRVKAAMEFVSSTCSEVFGADVSTELLSAENQKFYG